LGCGNLTTNRYISKLLHHRKYHHPQLPHFDYQIFSNIQTKKI